MEWKEFGIEEVARLCGIQMKNDGIGAREIKALCPFCGDKHYHLYLNTQKNQWNCFRCGARGNDVSLYARINCMTNKEAANELSNCITGTEPKRIQPINSTPMKSLMERHNVYYDMLQMLPLNNTHFNDLIKRGLSMKNIQNFLYKSVPANEYERREIIKKLSAQHDLSGIPGFYRKYMNLHTAVTLFPYAIKTGIYRVCKSDLTLTMTDIDGFLLMSIRRGQASPLGYTL